MLFNDIYFQIKHALEEKKTRAVNFEFSTTFAFLTLFSYWIY